MKKILLPVLLLGLVLAVGGVWYVARSSPAPAASTTAFETPAPAAETSPALATSETPIDAQEATAPGAERANLPAAEEGATESWDLAASIWVEGVVRAPSGCADDAVEVVATSAPIEADGVARILDRERHPKNLLSRRKVEDGGRFKIPFPPDAKVGHLSVRGKFLFTAESVSVDLSAKHVPVTLEPACGTLVVGTVGVPDPSPIPVSGLDGEDVTIRSSLQNFGGSPAGMRGFRRSAAIKNGAFEFRAIPAESACSLELGPTKLAAAALDVEKPTPGRETRVRLDLVRGGTVRGTVRDDAGTPVAGAEVEAARPGQWFGFDNREVRSGKSKDDGTFELEAVAPGAVVMKASLERYLESDRANIQVQDGGSANGVELKLTQGNKVSGTVAWADGKPAGDAQVDLRFDRSQLFGMGAFNAARGASGHAKTDAAGAFAITGLGKGPFTVEVEAPPPDPGASAGAPKDDGPEASDPGIMNKVTGKKKLWWRARADGVQPGASGVALVLRAPEGIPGHVVDEKGLPVAKFKIQAVRQGKGAMGAFGEEEREDSFEDEKGAFLMTGLMEGNWNLYAIADGFGLPEPVAIEIPRKADAPEIAIALEHSASIAGVVKNPNGAPASGATIALETGEPSWKAAIQTGPKPPKATSNADGTFVLDGLHAGKIRVAASSKEYAKSAFAEVDLTPAQHATGVELVLREGGTLTGEVYGEGGRPAVGMLVQSVQMKDFDTKMTFTGSKGEFKVEHLLAGSWQVIAMPARGDSQTAAPDDGKDVGDAATSLFQKMKMTVAAINDGEETHVVLGAPPKDPVDVHGTVTHAGEPLPGSMVIFVAEGKESLKSMKTCKVEKDGTYATRLDAAGHYSVSVQRGFGGMGQQSTVEFSEEIPEAKEYKLDLAMPTARISGIVRGPDGEPASGARVSLHPESPVAAGTMWGGQYHEGATDAEGKFDVQFLRAGTYSLAVGGTSLGALLGGDDAVVGREIRGGIRLSDGEWMRDADFRLKKPGTLNVTVVGADGQPVPEASVFARDANGRLVDALSMSSTDAGGKAKYKGLGPGTYTIVARKDLLTSTDSVHAKLDEGGSADVQVALQPGTIVIVTCIGGAESKPIRASISVQDESGREVGAMISIGEAMKMFSENGFSTMERRIGPVPQGKYTVRATDADGKTVTKQVNLSGQAERKLTIHFD